jgi:nucleoside-diphosphate-sugar epimerase
MSSALAAEIRARSVSAIMILAQLCSGDTAMGAVSGFEWKNRKVLVSGAAGFKGGWAAAILHELGAEVHGVTNSGKHPGSAFSLLGLNDLIHLHEGIDISNRRHVNELIRKIKPDVVFHLAAVASVPEAERDPSRCFEVNALAPAYVLAACRDYGVSRILICSTDHAPGPVPEADLPLPENYPLGRHSNAYDSSKAAAEILVRSMYATDRRNGLPRACITRGANFFGPGDVVERRVIPAFINKAFAERFVPLTVRKTGRQFISVDDGVSGYISAVSKLGDLPEISDGLGRPIVPTFHFSCETYPNTDRSFLRVEELANMVAELTGTRVQVLPGCVDFKAGENPAQALSCAQTRSQIGWQPLRGFEKPLEDLVEFLRPTTTHSERTKRIRDAVEEAAERLTLGTTHRELIAV